MTTSTEILRGMIDQAAQFVKRRFSKSGAIAPMWVAQTSKGTMLIPGTLEDPDVQIAMVRDVLREQNAVRVLMMHEGWILKCGPSEQDIPPEIRSGEMAIHDHPDGREVVMLQAEDRTHCIVARFYILRPEHGPPTLSPLQVEPPVAFSGNRLPSGRMVGLLR